MTVSININDTVSVKLTDEGRRVYTAFRTKVAEEFGNKYEPPAAPIDILSVDLWDLLYIFGPALKTCKYGLFVQGELIFGDSR